MEGQRITTTTDDGPAQQEGEAPLHSPQPNFTSCTTSACVPKCTVTLPTLHVRLHSTSNGQELSVRLTLQAKLEDLQHMLWRKFALVPSSYFLTLGAHPLQVDQPLHAQGVTEGSRILLHPVVA